MADLNASAAVNLAAPGRALAWSRRAILALTAAVLLGVAWSYVGAPLVLLAGCVLAGFGLTHLFGLPLLLEERLAFGTVVGAMAVSLAIFPLAMVFGLTPATVLGGLAVALAAGGAGLFAGRRSLAGEVADFGARLRGLWPLAVLLAVCWAWTLKLLSVAYVTTRNGGLDVANPGIYGDWAVHLTFAGSFAYGANFPPVLPIDPARHLGYPFMVDFLAATLVPLGASLPASLVLTSGLLGLAFPAVMFAAGARLTGGRLAAAVAVLVFVLGGGIGFVYLTPEVGRQGLAALQHLRQEYTHIPDLNYQWLNPVLAWLLPQRSMLFGTTIVLITAALLWTACISGPPPLAGGVGGGGCSTSPAQEGGRRRWRPFLFAGVVVGCAPLFHVHGYGTALALPAFWALLHRRREWIAFFLPAVLLGAPALLWVLSAGHMPIRQQLGWLAAAGGHNDNAAWFWLKNTGLFIPLLVVAQLWRGLLPARFALHVAPMWLWFAVPNVWVFQPWDWDNTKFFAYWALFGSLLVGALLVRLGRRGVLGFALACACFVLLGLSGALDLARTLDPTVVRSGYADAQGIDVAAWARDHTRPDAVFVVAPEHSEVIPTLAGRRVVAGYGGWLWTYGLTGWDTRVGDEEAMLRGDPRTPALVREYRVSYVVLGPPELGDPYRASQEYWEASAALVYSNGTYSVYQVR